MSRSTFGLIAVLTVLFSSKGISGAEKPPPVVDLSSFPTFDGKVVQVMGRFKWLLRSESGSGVSFEY